MIQTYIENKFPGEHPNRVIWRHKIIEACTSFANSGLADPTFISELISGEEQKFWAHLSEALVAQSLKDKKFPKRCKLGAGPDFLVMDGERKVWIEVICPEPVDLPDNWLKIQENTVTSFPHEKILLRWTSAIKAKAEQLLGSERRPAGYLDSGIVTNEDAYVIAVNGCRLRHGPFPSLMGISQFPFAAEATLGFGPFQININKETLETVGANHQHRPFVKNHNRTNVPAHMFLDPAFKPISAIWAVDLNGYSAFGGSEPMYVIHNPSATCPVSTGFLPSLHDYVARLEGDFFILDRPRQNGQ